jgi:hypothetical protein
MVFLRTWPRIAFGRKQPEHLLAHADYPTRPLPDRRRAIYFWGNFLFVGANGPVLGKFTKDEPSQPC